MANDEAATSTPAVIEPKSPTSRNHSPTRLPALATKSHASSFKSASMQLPKSRSKQKDALMQSSSFKIERPTVSVVPKARLPALGSTSTDPEQKRHSEYQRRQIYALNRLMRDLEQEKFRQFFKSEEANDTPPAETTADVEEAQAQPSE